MQIIYLPTHTRQYTVQSLSNASKALANADLTIPADASGYYYILIVCTVLSYNIYS